MLTLPSILLSCALIAMPLAVSTCASPCSGDEHATRKPRNLAKEHPKLQAQIDAAIQRGAKWLASLQKSDGTFGMPKGRTPSLFEKDRRRVGLHSLVLYTLAHCGYDKDHRITKKAVAWLRKKYDSLLSGDHLAQATSYSLALAVLGLHQLYAQPAQEAKSARASRYARSRRRRANPCSYPKWVRRAMWTVLDWMLKHRSKKGLFRYPGGLPHGAMMPAQPNGIRRGGSFAGPEDLSCSQYVLLALWVGTRCGYRVPEKTLKAIAERLLAVQEESGPKVARAVDPRALSEEEVAEGGRYARPTPLGKSGPKDGVVVDRARGFGYTPGDGSTGAMTTAGLSSLMIVKAILAENYQLDTQLHKRIDKGIWDAIAWLQVNFTVKENHPVGALWHYYYLYGLERALVIADKRFLGKHDWYVEGARLLVDQQKKAGCWVPEGSLGAHAPPGARLPITDTCFALLFLKRAAFKPKTPLLRGPVVTGEAK